MGYNVSIVTSSEELKGQAYSARNGRLIVLATIYLELGSAVKNVGLYRTDPLNAYQRFINEMDDASLGTTPTDELVEIDDWLSLLGVSETFPISRFIFDYQKKITAQYKSPTLTNEEI